MYTLHCLTCGKEFTSPYPTRKYCCKKCYGISRVKVFTCPTCGKVIERKSKNKFCSRECFEATRRGFPSGKTKYPQSVIDNILTLYPIHGLQKTSELLGIDAQYIKGLVSRYRVRANSDVIKRSAKLANSERMRTNNPMKNPDTQAKVKHWWITHPEEMEQTMNALNIGKQKAQRDKPSGLEKKLRSILDTLNVDYEPSAMIKDNFIVDIRIGNVILEADGDYWHGHPRFEPLTERQIAQQKRDASRNKYLSACGYTVVRIWESDMTFENVRSILIRLSLILL